MNCIYENGKVYGLIGYNGSGKTTLLKTIAGIFRQEEGEILAEGGPLTRMRNSGEILSL